MDRVRSDTGDRFGRAAARRERRQDEAEDQRVERDARYGGLPTASDGRIADARDSGAQLHPQAQRAPTSSTPTASPGAPASRLSAVSNGVPSARARAT